MLFLGFRAFLRKKETLIKSHCCMSVCLSVSLYVCQDPLSQERLDMSN